MSQLSIVIPAYNEEESIASTLEKTVAARESITRQGGLNEVEILVVDDGSTDATSREFEQCLKRLNRPGGVRLVKHEVNRGYGAAIKTGFAAASGDILGFMDADGTCDPETFGPLCKALDEDRADVAIGSRMIRDDTGMPLTRRIGNTVFAGLLSLISGTRVTDSASGMRVIRRSSMPLLSPLPDGLHFTPAMSARAVLDPDLKIVEIPMTYDERVGESKLGVFRDGVRFLSVILEIAVTYKPLRFFGAAGAAFLALALAYGLKPLWQYIQMHSVEEWMIYRLLAVMVFTVAGITLVAIGLLANAMVRSIQRLHLSSVGGQCAPAARKKWQRLLLNSLPVTGLLLGLVGVFINRGVLWEYLTTGHITAHWTYPVTGAFFVLCGLQLFSFGVIYRIVATLDDKRVFLFTGNKPHSGSE